MHQTTTRRRTMPGYTAEASLQPSSRPYFTPHGYRHQGAAGGSVIAAEDPGALGYACSGSTCACHGIADCQLMCLFGGCPDVPACSCDFSGTCICPH